MHLYDVADLDGPADWTGPTVAIGSASAKLRWTSSPYRWHRNHGAEMFLVLEGMVDMHVRPGSGEEVRVTRLMPGQAVLIEDGEEHVAYPCGAAKILVVEEEGAP